jgi:hypothetical protein
MLPAASAPGQVIRPRRLPVRVPGWLAAPAAPLARITAAAGGGFLAGVALMGLLRRRRGRRALAATRRRTRRGAGAQERGRGAELVQVVGSRSLLVDVHWLGKR